jgi:hypothetical protein
MAGNTQDDPTLQAQNLQLRVALSDAYAAVEGAKTVQTFNAITFEDLAQQQIQRISGPDTQTRPNELNQVKAILNNLTNAVAQIKALPPESFADQDASRDVNTPP